jgi:hypothetical protein
VRARSLCSRASAKLSVPPHHGDVITLIAKLREAVQIVKDMIRWIRGALAELCCPQRVH